MWIYSVFHSQIKTSFFEVAYHHHLTSGVVFKNKKKKTFGELIHCVDRNLYLIRRIKVCYQTIVLVCQNVDDEKLKTL